MWQSIQAHPSWPHFRGMLILLHVVAITVGSLPILIDERGLTPEAWQDPIALTEFAQWTERLNGWGFEVTEEEFAQGAWNAAEGLLNTQRTLRRPFLPYYAETGTKQRWRMFPAAVESPSRLRIDIERDGAWETVYVMGSREKGERWLAHYFDRDRFRAALNLYAWNIYPEAFDELSHWVASQASRDFSDARRLRIGFEILPAISPEEARDGQRRVPLPFEEARRYREIDLKAYDGER